MTPVKYGPPGDPVTWPADHWLAERGRAAWAEGRCPGCLDSLEEPDICISGHGGLRVRWAAEPDGAITFWTQGILPESGQMTPGQYTRRAGAGRRTPAPVRGKTIGTGLAYALLAIVMFCGWAGYELVMAPFRIWHTTTPDGQNIPSTTAWVAWTVVAVAVIVVIKALLIATGKGKQAPPKYRDPVLVVDACEHPNAVPVDLLVTGERVARWCPDCETQLPAELPPPPPKPVKPQIWEWRWWCTCGYDASSAAYTEQDAKTTAERTAAAHAAGRPWAGHSWQGEWKPAA